MVPLIRLCFLFLQGCTYAISPSVADQADRSIAFASLMHEAARYTGKTVIVGGVIAATQHTPQGTLIEVVQKELDYWGKPRRTDKSGGRFLLRHPGLLDSLVYAPGRELTAGAEVLGSYAQSLGPESARYPLLRSRELKLWEAERQSWSKPQWMDPLYDPYGPARGDR